ncbi:4'-phosphopantetheinyl transferase family protein [Streptomyces sp. NPDC012888]|uniref:4'-phosphopantetheinyl transferase family protein n=1 Tax=Streptomyces sp. NPDC012888 TaxID=3364855 RepID=UPI0036CF894D
MIEYVKELGEAVAVTGAPPAPARPPGPAGPAVDVWSLDISRQVVGGHPVAGALPLLDDAERERAARLLRPADRHRYLASHVGLRVLLGGYLGLAPQEVALVREVCPGCGGPHGRPAVAGGSLHFSLSHSEDRAYLAFAAVPVGVDVEAWPAPAAVADVVGTLHPRESAEVRALPEPARPAALARIWTRKEALLKGTGEGLGSGVAEPYVGSAPDPAAVPGWSLLDLPAPHRYAAALAVAAA